MNAKTYAVVAALALAGVAGTVHAYSDPVVREVFPWCEIGDTLESADDLEFISWVEPYGEFACAKFAVKDGTMPANERAFVVLAEDGSVMSIRRECDCADDDEAEEAVVEISDEFLKYAVADGTGTKVVEIYPMTGAKFHVTVTDIGYFRAINADDDEED